MNLVLDTCALIWLTLEQDSLSGKAHKMIAAADRLFVSSISIWEIGVKVTRQKIDLGTTLSDYVERLSHAKEIEIIPVSHQTWVRSVLLDWTHRDPADRVIVALAEELDLPIVTDDSVIKKYYKNSVF